MKQRFRHILSSIGLTLVIFIFIKYKIYGGGRFYHKPLEKNDGKFYTYNNTQCQISNIKREKRIFFIETSKRRIKARALCAIESAAYHNPDYHVTFYRPSSDQKYEALSDAYENIHFRKLNPAKLVAGTPAESLINGPSLTEERLPEYFTVLSDVLRPVLVYKYGGIYMDTDILSLKQIPRNCDMENFLIRDEYESRKDQDNINNAVLGFQNPGNEFLKRLIRLIVEEFNGTRWGHEGPRAVTKVSHDYCESKHLVQLKNNCSITFLPENSFYPVHYYRWETLFDPLMRDEIRETIQESVTVHFYNKLSQDMAMDERTMPIMDIARNNCPLIYQREFEPYFEN